jgi:hypothetical protein
MDIEGLCSLTVLPARQKTKVYIVTAGSYSDYHIEAVFSEKEFAEKYVEVAKGLLGSNDFGVEEWCLDLPEKEWVLTSVHMSRDGEVKHVAQDLDTNAVEGFACFDYENNLVWYVRTRDKERAVKVVNEKRVIILAHDLWSREMRRVSFVTSGITSVLR